VVHALLEQRREQERLRGGSESVRELMTRGGLSMELGPSEARLELTEQAENSLREERGRLQAELEAERAERRRLAEHWGKASKGFGEGYSEAVEGV
jgi:hypothetical protein